METTHTVNQLTVKNIKKSIKDRKILEDVSFSVSRGQMFAILGPTGSGKSTLLNIITGRLKCDSGSITVDGKPVDKRLRRRFGYVLQNDVFFTNLTLWQTLYFTAQIQMPECLSKEEKLNKLNTVIEAMDLNKCLHTVIGDLFVRGLSGGEKKRASIACELLTDPAILFLDEPTSGLDSSTAWSIVQHLKSEAVSKNRIVVSTIHQPSSQIFHDFDKLLLITGGKTGYYGGPEDVQTHFASLGLHCKPNYNPADFLLEIAKADENTMKTITDAAKINERTPNGTQNGVKPMESNGMIECYRKLPEHNGCFTNKAYSSDENGSSMFCEIVIERPDMQTTVGKDYQRWSTSFLHQLRMLIWRGFIQSRGKVLNRYVLCELFTVSLCIALGSFRKGIGLEQSRDVMGLIFITFTYWSFQISIATLLTFPEQRPVIAKERAAGAYRLSALYIAKTVSELPIMLCISIVGFTVNFWISEIGGLVVYLKTVALFALWGFLWQALSIFLGSVLKSPRLALTVFQSYSISSFVYGGYIIQQLPNWLLWLKYLSLYWYAVSGATKIVFSDLDPISCNATTQTSVYSQSACLNRTVVTSDVILQDAGIDLPLLHYILPLIAIDLVFRLIAYLAMRFRKDTIL